MTATVSVIGRPFQKGQSGNPGGKSKEEAAVRRIAQEAGEDAIRKLISLMDSKDEKVALVAAERILDRAFGRPLPMAPIADDDTSTGERVDIVRLAREIAFVLAMAGERRSTAPVLTSNSTDQEDT